MVFVRTDANKEIASGHVMRCITIACELIRKGIDTTFIISDENSAELLLDFNMKYIILHTDWKRINTSKEIDAIKEILVESRKSSGRFPLLLVDSYSADASYFLMLKGAAALGIIDDLGDYKYDVDILINYNVFCDIFKYERVYKNANTVLLLGPRYVPLREQFRGTGKNYNEFRDITKKSHKRVLVMCGGGDSIGILKSILMYAEKQSEMENYDFVVISGKYNPFFEELNDICIRNNRIELYESVYNIASIMKGCDYVVSAASTVLYECCAMGVPTVFYCMADNQEGDVEFFSNNIMLFAGDARIDKHGVIIRIFELLHYLDNNISSTKKMQQLMMGIIDGMGAIRIASEIEQLLERTNA